MVETLGALSPQQLMTYVIAALAVLFALDVWGRIGRGLRVLNEGAAARARLHAGIGLFLWLSLALAFTLIEPLRAFGNSLRWLQPLLTLSGVAVVFGLVSIPSLRRAFDSLSMQDVISISYWRAIFGMGLLAFYTGGVLPGAFALQAGIGDIVVGCVMVVLLAVAERTGQVPRRPLLVWNTLGLLDLVNAMFLVTTVLRPWAAARGVSVGNYTLAAFAVPIFIALHLHIYARLFRERTARRSRIRTEGNIA